MALLVSQGALGATRSEIDRLPSRADESKVFLQMRNSIAFIESRGDPSARNQKTSASGKYQFIKSWDRFFLRYSGKSWTAQVPSRKAPQATKFRFGQIQDQLFNRYFEIVVSPWIQNVRKQRIGETYTDPELVAIVHRQGTKGAYLYLTKGHDPYAGKYGNRHVSKHILAMRKAMRFENYLSHMGDQ